MTRLIAFAILGGGIFGAVWFVPTFVATVVIWRNAQGPLLAFGFLPFAFTIGATFGALSAWHE